MRSIGLLAQHPLRPKRGRGRIRNTKYEGDRSRKERDLSSRALWQAARQSVQGLSVLGFGLAVDTRKEGGKGGRGGNALLCIFLSIYLSIFLSEWSMSIMDMSLTFQCKSVMITGGGLCGSTTHVD